MKVTWAAKAWQDYVYWQDEDRTVRQRINLLIEECRRTPFKGTGRPEPLKANYSGFWSRRITDEHRLIYRVSGSGDEQVLDIAQCRYHYKDSGHRKR